MKYNQIILAIPRKWKRLLQTSLLTNVGSSDRIPYKCFSNIQTVKNSQIYKYFVTQKIITPVSQNKWVEYYPFLEHVDWKKIYMLCFKIVKDTYIIQTMQFKILHRVYNYVHPPGGCIYYFCFFRRPASDVRRHAWFLLI